MDSAEAPVGEISMPAPQRQLTLPEASSFNFSSADRLYCTTRSRRRACSSLALIRASWLRGQT
jgi:hypothetical protein